jgi:8-oxo-dGTP diphosphatase
MTRLRVATLAVAHHRGRVLLLRRRKEPNLGLWSPPGGMIEPDEDPAQSAEREFLEETGLHLLRARLSVIVAESDVSTGDAWLMFVYRGEASGAPRRDGREGRPTWVRLRDVSRLPKPPADSAILAAASAPGLTVLRVTFRDGELVSCTSRPASTGAARALG